MIGDLRLDAIAAATRQRDGDAAVTLTGLMLADKAGEAIQQLATAWATPASRRGRTECSERLRRAGLVSLIWPHRDGAKSS